MGLVLGVCMDAAAMAAEVVAPALANPLTDTEPPPLTALDPDLLREAGEAAVFEPLNRTMTACPNDVDHRSGAESVPPAETKFKSSAGVVLRRREFCGDDGEEAGL